jgi:D-3-phosphoglycerate dehydrogenase
MPHVLVAGRIHDAGLALLRSAAGVTLEVVPEVTTESYAPLIDRADAVLIRTQPMPASVIERASRLQIVSRHGVGFDAIDVAALNRRNIPLAVIDDVNSTAVAEHAMTLILTVAKRTLAYDRRTKVGDWEFRNSLAAIELAEKSLLLVGFGRIGRRVAKLAAAFGMEVQAFDPFIPEAELRNYGVIPVRELHSGLKSADVISIHAPLAGSGPLIGPRELAAMKPTAILINTSRGGLVEEHSLAKALNEGRLLGAGLDVFADEPARPSNPLFASERVVVSPHAAALTREGSARMSASAARNILDFFVGKLNPALVVNAASIPFLNSSRPR